MMSRTPWREDAPARLPFTHAQAATAQATHPSWASPIDLPLEAGSSITFDEQRAPRCTATLVTKAGLDDATFAALDPRSGVRIKISAGYLWPDGVDVWPVVDLQLRDRRVARPGDRLTLAASGEEARVIEGGGPTSALVLNGTNVTAATTEVIQRATGAAPVFAESALPLVDAGLVKIEAGQEWWAFLDDLADRVAKAAGLEGGDVWHDGLTGWHLAPRPAIGLPDHELVVGRAGTVLTSDAGLTRDGWGNVVNISYRWVEAVTSTDSSGKVTVTYVNRFVLGTAAVTAGPMRPEVAGRAVYAEERNVPTDQAAANAVAAALLARKVSAGRSLELDALSAWWLRPGATVRAQLLTGPSELHLLSAVTFDLTEGRMRVRTRRPDTDSTITQGA